MPPDLAIPLLDTYPKEMKSLSQKRYQHSCSWKQPKSPLMDTPVKNM